MVVKWISGEQLSHSSQGFGERACGLAFPYQETLTWLREDGGPPFSVVVRQGWTGVPRLGATESPDSDVQSLRARKHTALQSERPSRSVTFAEAQVS